MSIICSFDKKGDKFNYYRIKDCIEKLCKKTKESANEIIKREKKEIIPLIQEKLIVIMNKKYVIYTKKSFV